MILSLPGDRPSRRYRRSRHVVQLQADQLPSQPDRDLGETLRRSEVRDDDVGVVGHAGVVVRETSIECPAREQSETVRAYLVQDGHNVGGEETTVPSQPRLEGSSGEISEARSSPRRPRFRLKHEGGWIRRPHQVHVGRPGSETPFARDMELSEIASGLVEVSQGCVEDLGRQQVWEQVRKYGRRIGRHVYVLGRPPGRGPRKRQRELADEGILGQVGHLSPYVEASSRLGRSSRPPSTSIRAARGRG